MGTRDTISKILETRGYLVDREALALAQDFYAADKGAGADRIFVFFPQNSPKVGVALIRNYISEMKAAGVQRAIIIGKDEITPNAKQIFTANEDLTIEYFRESEVLIDKLSHELVPKHELLSDAEKEQLLAAYKIKETQLPKMTSSDAIARYFGARKGQVFRITRPSESSGTTVYYRIVA